MHLSKIQKQYKEEDIRIIKNLEEDEEGVSKIYKGDEFLFSIQDMQSIKTFIKSDQFISHILDMNLTPVELDFTYIDEDIRAELTTQASGGVSISFYYQGKLFKQGFMKIESLKELCEELSELFDYYKQNLDLYVEERS